MVAAGAAATGAGRRLAAGFATGAARNRGACGFRPVLLLSLVFVPVISPQ